MSETSKGDRERKRKNKERERETEGSGIHRIDTKGHETPKERQRQKEIVDRLPRPSDDPSATSLRVRRCLFPSLVACR